MKNKYIHLIIALLVSVLTVIAMIVLNLKMNTPEGKVLFSSTTKMIINDCLGIGLAIVVGYSIYNFAKDKHQLN